MLHQPSRSCWILPAGCLLRAGKFLLEQPVELSYSSQMCPLCSGRLVSNLQHVNNNITLLTTSGPKNARLVSASAIFKHHYYEAENMPVNFHQQTILQSASMQQNVVTSMPR